MKLSIDFKSLFPCLFIFFFLTVVLIYCEKFKKNDYLIGVILASMLFTKYTTGVF